MRHRAGSEAASVEREFARALGLEVAAAGRFSYRTVASRLRNLERRYLKRVGSRRAAREVRRRIAEQMLQQAVFHDCSLAVCRLKFNVLAQLGFTSIQRKGHFHLLYAKGALARGHKRAAQIAAQAIAKDLDRSMSQRKSSLTRDLSQAFLIFWHDLEGSQQR